MNSMVFSMSQEPQNPNVLNIDLEYRGDDDPQVVKLYEAADSEDTELVIKYINNGIRPDNEALKFFVDIGYDEYYGNVRQDDIKKRLELALTKRNSKEVFWALEAINLKNVINFVFGEDNPRSLRNITRKRELVEEIVNRFNLDPILEALIKVHNYGEDINTLWVEMATKNMPNNLQDILTNILKSQYNGELHTMYHLYKQ